MRSLLLAGTLVLALAAGACNRANDSASNKHSNTSKTASNRKPAPDFTLQDASGSSVKLSDLRGKVVLLNFWATWCGPCALEIPWFKEFEQQYKNQGLEIVGVSMDEDGWKAVKPYISQHQLNYRVLLGNDSVGQLYGGVDSLPTTFLIDRQGRMAYPPHIGLVSKNEYLQEIQTLLHDNDTNTQRSSLRGAPAVWSVVAGSVRPAAAAQH